MLVAQWVGGEIAAWESRCVVVLAGISIGNNWRSLGGRQTSYHLRIC